MKVSFADFDFAKTTQQCFRKLGISEPTPIQLKSFSTNYVWKRCNGIAQTGTGKTLFIFFQFLKLGNTIKRKSNCTYPCSYT